MSKIAGTSHRSELLEHEFAGLARGIDLVLGLDGSEALTPDLLLRLHRECFGLIFPDWAGTYRTVDVETSSHRFPPFYQVPELVGNFFGDLNERLRHGPDPVALVACAQHRIVWIHPFKDYNGRTGRLFVNLLMLRLGLPLVEIEARSEEDRYAYIAALKRADEGDYSGLELLIGQAVGAQGSASGS